MLHRLSISWQPNIKLCPAIKKYEYSWFIYCGIVTCNNNYITASSFHSYNHLESFFIHKFPNHIQYVCVCFSFHSFHSIFQFHNLHHIKMHKFTIANSRYFTFGYVEITHNPVRAPLRFAPSFNKSASGNGKKCLPNN